MYVAGFFAVDVVCFAGAAGCVAAAVGLCVAAAAGFLIVAERNTQADRDVWAVG